MFTPCNKPNQTMPSCTEPSIWMLQCTLKCGLCEHNARYWCTAIDVGSYTDAENLTVTPDIAWLHALIDFFKVWHHNRTCTISKCMPNPTLAYLYGSVHSYITSRSTDWTATRPTCFPHCVGLIKIVPDTVDAMDGWVGLSVVAYMAW